MKRDLTQLVDCVRSAMADAGVTETTFIMEYQAPVTLEQRDMCQRFCSRAMEMGLQFQASEGPEGILASVVITNGRA